MIRKGNRGVTKHLAIIFSGIMILDQVRSTMAFCIRILALNKIGKLKRSKMCLHSDYVSVCRSLESIYFLFCLFTVPVHLFALNKYVQLNHHCTALHDKIWMCDHLPVSILSDNRTRWDHLNLLPLKHSTWYFSLDLQQNHSLVLLTQWDHLIQSND